MSRFLFIMIEGGGNVPPQLGLAGRLRARGHEVHVLGDPAIESDAHALGLDLRPFQHAPHHNLRNRDHDRVRDYEAKDRRDALRRMVEAVSFGPAEDYARDTTDAIEELAPDVVLVDCVLLGAAVAAEQSGLPMVLLMHTIYFPTVSGVPPYGFGYRPARSVFARMGHKALRRLATRWFDRMGLDTINQLRTARGLPSLQHVAEQYDRAARLLVMTAPSFDFASRVPLPPNVRYVGPGLDDPAWTAAASSRGQLSDAAATSVLVPPGDAPLVVVGLGSTFQDQKSLTQRVTDAVAGLPVRGLVTLGEVFETDELSAPDHVRVVRAAPHARVFPEASVVVAHGGHGTVMKALSCGVPVLCFWLGRDQADIAARVEASGAGLRISASADADTIRQALTRLLEEPVFRERATKLAQEIRELQRADPAVREVEALIPPSAMLRAHG